MLICPRGDAYVAFTWGFFIQEGFPLDRTCTQNPPFKTHSPRFKNRTLHESAQRSSKHARPRDESSPLLLRTFQEYSPTSDMHRDRHSHFSTSANTAKTFNASSVCPSPNTPFLTIIYGTRNHVTSSGPKP